MPSSLSQKRAQVTQEDLVAVIADFVPPSYPLEVELQNLVAVQECTSRELIPEAFKAMPRDQLTRRVRASLDRWLGADNVKTIEAEMGGEDFSQFSRTVEKVPVCMFRVGAVDPAKVAESQRTGVPLPSLHSSNFAPLPEPTIKTGVTALTAAALDLLAKP